MEFEVLGPVRLARGDMGSVLSGRLQRTLLAVLLAHANRPVPTDVLTDVLWPDAPDPRAEQNLRLHVHRLRRALADADRLAFEPGGYRLSVSPGELDAERFESLADEASQLAEQEPERSADLARKALNLWRGRAYDGFDVATIVDEAKRLEDRRLAAVEVLYEAELACGRDAAVVAELPDLVGRHPLRERLAALLMTALYRSGRQAEALQVYQEARRVLVEELGLEPGPELRAIEQQVLAGEPVTLGRPEPARLVPAQLPVNVRGFVGREDEIVALDRLVTGGGESTAIVTLSGTAGVGKTALAVRWAHLAREQFPDGQLYVDLRGYGPDHPLPPGDALARFLRALGLEGAAIPQDPDERAASYRSQLAGRRILVVLDNARSVDQVRPLLPGTPESAVVISSRDSLSGLGAREGARRLDLDRLSVGESRDLMAELLEDEATTGSAVLDELIEQCARLPLALRIAADLVQSRPARGIVGLVAQLVDEGDRLDLLDVDEDPYSAVRAVFSWSYQQLSPDAARLFRLCGLHPGVDFDAYALAALAGFERPITQQHLNTLVRSHLLDETSDGRLRAHDLLRAYAKELAERDDTTDGRTGAIARLSAHYLHTVSEAMQLIAPHESRRLPAVPDTESETPSFADYDGARQWLDREIGSVLAVVTVGSDRYVAALSNLLWPYLHMRGYYDEALTLHRRASTIAQRGNDQEAESRAIRLIAHVHYFLADFEESIRYDERALALSRGDRRDEAVTLSNIGASYQRLGQLRDALHCFEKSMTILAELGEQNVPTSTNLGLLQLLLGRYESSATSLEQALALAREQGDRNTRDTIVCMQSDLAVRTGRAAEGLDLARQALAGAREAGNRSAEADALTTLGNCHRHFRDHQQSEECLIEALDIARSIGNNATIAEALNGLGRSLHAGGESRRALRKHDAALEVATASGIRFEEASALTGAGDAYADLGDTDRAREHWQRALAIWSDMGVPEVDEVRAKLDRLD